MLLDDLKRGDLANFNKPIVEAFLIRNLRWGVLHTQSDTDLGVINPLDARVTVHVNTNLPQVLPGLVGPEELEFAELDEEIVSKIRNDRVLVAVADDETGLL